MKGQLLSVRELKEEDIGLIIKYWTGASPGFLNSMGVDLNKLPSQGYLVEMLTEQIAIPLEKKLSYALVWLVDNKPAGHSNVNKIQFGKEAYMHLHLWQPEYRQKGLGTALVIKSLPYFFENLKLGKLYCEPYALNAAPNKTLENAGFEFEKEYITVPGSINFEQRVKRWKLTKANYLKITQQQQV